MVPLLFSMKSSQRYSDFRRTSMQRPVIPEKFLLGLSFEVVVNLGWGLKLLANLNLHTCATLFTPSASVCSLLPISLAKAGVYAGRKAGPCAWCGVASTNMNSISVITNMWLPKTDTGLWTFFFFEFATLGSASRSVNRSSELLVLVHRTPCVEPTHSPLMMITVSQEIEQVNKCQEKESGDVNGLNRRRTCFPTDSRVVQFLQPFSEPHDPSKSVCHHPSFPVTEETIYQSNETERTN